MSRPAKAKREAQAAGSVAVQKRSGFPRLLILPLAFMVAGVLIGGGWLYRSHGRDMRQEAKQNLLAIANLKADQISQWRAERLADAAVIMESPFFIEIVPQWMRAPQASVADELIGRFRSLKEHYGYSDVYLVNPAGQVCLSLSGHVGPLQEIAAKALAVSLRERRPGLTDLHPGPGDASPHLDVIAPLFAQEDNAAEPVGAIMLRSDARQFLYPLIQSWPTLSRTAETLLVCREEDSALFLNELRHQSNTALKLRIPLSRKDVTAVMAVQGNEGIVQGKDYRGVPVLAVLKAIPGSGWFMVAKVDEKEALANWRFRSVLLVLLTLGILAFAAAGVLVVWQRNEKANYRALFEAEAARRESEERFRTTVMSIGDGVITTDAAGRVEIINPVAESLTGWKQDEARGRPLEEVFHIVNEETRQKVESPVSRVVREGMVVGLANHTLLIARDGREYAVADCGAPVRSEAGEITGVALVFHDQTAVRAADKALRQSEEKYRSLAESSQDAIYLVDDNGRFLFANTIYLSRLGLKSEQVIGKPYGEFHPADDADEFMEKLKQVFETGRWVSYEHRSHRDNRLFLRTLSPVRETAEGRTAAATVISKDITAYKQAEDELRESEEKYRTLIEQSLQGVIVIQDFRIVFANTALAEIAGYTVEELLSLSPEGVKAMVHPEDQAMVWGRFRDRLEGKPVPARYEYRGIRKDGEMRWLEMFSSRIEYKGKPAVQGAFIDITERRRAEEELKESEKRFRELVESANDVIYTHDLQGNFTSVNPAATRIYGYTNEEILKLNIAQIVDPEYLPLARQKIKEKLDGAIETGPYELLTYSKHGEPIWVEVSTRLLMRENQPVGVLGIARDVTRRKQDEEKLMAVLREREVMLREIHHRVKNNIQIISSLLRLQAQHVRDDKVLEILNESQSRIRSMALIHEKLYQSQDFARIDFSDYISKMITHLFAMFNLPADRVRFRIEAEKIQLDINRAIPCGLIINELVTNALKHAFPGERKGELVVRMNRQDGDHYRLSVKDNGAGLPQGFDPEKQKTLGFQIVHDLVRQLNGSIEFLGEEGTEIIVRF